MLSFFLQRDFLTESLRPFSPLEQAWLVTAVAASPMVVGLVSLLPLLAVAKLWLHYKRSTSGLVGKGVALPRRLATTAAALPGPTLLLLTVPLLLLDLERTAQMLEVARDCIPAAGAVGRGVKPLTAAVDFGAFGGDAAALAVSAFGLLLFAAYVRSLGTLGWRELHLTALFGLQLGLLWSGDVPTFLLLLETGNLYLYFLLVRYGALQRPTAAAPLRTAAAPAGWFRDWPTGIDRPLRGEYFGAVRAVGVGKTALEAVFGYFLLNLAGSLLLLLGFGQLYIALGTLHFGDMALLLQPTAEGLELFTGTLVPWGAATVLCGIALKLGLAPFHIWLAGIYERFPTYLFVFGQVFPKLFLLAFALRFWGLLGLDSTVWPELTLLLLVLGTLNLVVGAIGALGQPELKRVLLYSSLANLGLIFYALAAGGGLSGGGMLLLLVYVLTTACVTLPLLAGEGQSDSVGESGRRIGEAAGASRSALLSWRLAELARVASPQLRLTLAQALLHLSGVPPFALFFAKLPLLVELLEDGFFGVVAIALVMAVVAVAYAFGPLGSLLFGLYTSGHRREGAAQQPSVGVLSTARCESAAAAAARRDVLELLLLLTLVYWCATGVAGELSTEALLSAAAPPTGEPNTVLRTGVRLTALLWLLLLGSMVNLHLRYGGTFTPEVTAPSQGPAALLAKLRQKRLERQSAGGGLSAGAGVAVGSGEGRPATGEAVEAAEAAGTAETTGVVEAAGAAEAVGIEEAAKAAGVAEAMDAAAYEVASKAAVTLRFIRPCVSQNGTEAADRWVEAFPRVWQPAEDYVLLLGALLCSGLLVALLALVGRALGSYPRMGAHNRALASVYECGFAPFEGLVASSLFLFYRLAVFFVVFEAELLLLYPWAAALMANASLDSHAFFYAPAFFIGALLYGFVVEVEAEALDL
jgi:NADH:ubiquinone oxidoreductase subunit 2 (subunit N)/NADH:ubiquinone oxidoreductase subunit 3 (subunit A)